MNQQYRSYKSLRYSTAIAVSLIALSTANQAHAQCAPAASAGNDTITCTGTQTGGIDLQGGTDTITNNGTIQNTGTGTRDAIVSTTGSGSYTIVNNGIISVGSTSGSGSRGVHIQAGNLDGLTNALGATIEVTAPAFANARALYIRSGTTGNITNAGTITSTGLGATFDGALSVHSGAFNNSGTITGASIGINVTGADFAGGFTNSGTIRGNGFGALSFAGGGDASGGITNTSTGLIEGVGGFGIAVGSSSGADISGGINNAGIIRGNIGIHATDTSSSGVGISGGITNSGTIEGTGGNAILYEDIDQVSAININGGRIIGNVTDNFGDGTTFSPVTIVGSGFDTEGDFTVSSLTVNAGQEFRISTGDTFNTRSMSMGAGSTINFEVDAAGAVGALNVTNGAIDLTGGAIGAEVDPAADGVLMDGDEIQIGTGTAALIGTTGAVGQALTSVTDDSLLWDFSIADGGQAEITGSVDANNLFFLVSQAASAGGSAVTTNANTAGTVINTLMGTTNPALSSIVSNVNAASTSEELEEILQAVLPQVDTGSLSAAQNVTGNTIRLVSDRLTTIRTGGRSQRGISSGDLAEDLHMWAQISGQKAEQGERDGVAGFEADTYSVTVGADTEGVHDNATVGLALSYANTDVDSDNATNTQSDINSYNFTVYGDYDLNNDTYLIGDIGYTYGDNDTTRYNVGGVAGLNANSDYGSHQVQARAILAKDYYPSHYEGLRVTPKALAKYTYFTNEDFTESGAGGANLSVDSEALNIFELGVGVDVRKDYVQADGGIISPEISAGYRYDLVGDAVQTTSTFEGGGASFRSEGADPDQDTLNLGLGIGYTAPSSMEFTVSYDYENKDEFDSHSAFIRLAAPF